MKLTYDKSVDAAYLSFTKKKIECTIEVTNYIIVDVTRRGKMVGIEFLDASDHLPAKLLRKPKHTFK